MNTVYRMQSNAKCRKFSKLLQLFPLQTDVAFAACQATDTNSIPETTAKCGVFRVTSDLSDTRRTTMHIDQLLEDALLKKVVWTFSQECDTSLPWEQAWVRATDHQTEPWHSLQPLPAAQHLLPRQLPAAPSRWCEETPRKSTEEMPVLRSQNLDTGLHS